MNLRIPGPEEMIVVAIRHGQTESNAAKLYVGQSESPLSALGRRQAAALGERLRGATFDAVCASGLSRAADTAAAVTAHHAVDAILDPRLRERHYGVLDGVGFEEEAPIRFPDVCDGLRTASPDYVIPEGESAQHVRDRLARFMDDLLTAHIGQTVAAVAHGGVVRILLWTLLDLPYRVAQYSRCENTSVSVFRYFRGTWHLDLWNDAAHLETLAG